MKNDALEELYLRYHKEILLYLYSLCKNMQLSEDLCQDTFVKALLSLSEKHKNVRAWLYLVARNLFLNSSRNLKRETDQEDVPEEAVDDKILDNMISAERSKLIYKAMQKLAPQKREILVLQYWGELSQKEIAAVMKLTPENVRVLGYRGKKDLKKILEENGYEIY